MAHLALYREWRPKTFDEVVEQKHAVYALKQSVVSGQIAHAYLFSGTRGTGKTTMAKIFSRAINCLNPQQGNPCNRCDICRAALDGSLMDIIEMDAASNNSVDNIRRICDEIVFMPSQARYKVYIIDEVHMLSAGAFNALLKTLEEPPAHAVFILATTEAHRIPATILSRCQRYEFRRIPVDSMVGRLQQIAANGEITIQPDALHTIAALADGALRDAISILDQARSAFPPPITHDQVLSLVGVVRDQFLQKVATALIHGQIDILLQLIDQLIRDGRDLTRFVTDLAQHLRNLLVCQVASDDALLIRVHSEALADMKSLSGQVERKRLIELIRGLSALLSDLRWAPDGRTALEIGMIRLTDNQNAVIQQTASARQGQPEMKSEKSDHQPLQVDSSEKAARQSVKPVLPAPAGLPEEPVMSSEPDEEAGTDVPLPEPPPEDAAWHDAEDTESPIIADKVIAPGRQSAQRQLPQKRTEARQAENLGQRQELVGQSNPDDVQAHLIWQRVLDKLQESGQMTLYLFSRPAEISLCQDIWQMNFSAGDVVHYQEINQPGSLKVIREAVRACTGKDWQVRPVLLETEEQPGCREPTETSWVEKVKRTADQLGIPVEVEE
jgi:DNA polymerase III subunit gamma/tau